MPVESSFNAPSETAVVHFIPTDRAILREDDVPRDRSSLLLFAARMIRAGRRLSHTRTNGYHGDVLIRNRAPRTGRQEDDRESPAGGKLVDLRDLRSSAVVVVRAAASNFTISH